MNNNTKLIFMFMLGIIVGIAFTLATEQNKDTEYILEVIDVLEDYRESDISYNGTKITHTYKIYNGQYETKQDVYTIEELIELGKQLDDN